MHLPDTIHHATREKSYRTKIQCALWTTILLGGLALLFTLYSNFWCHYASTKALLTNNNDGTTSYFPVYHGIWNYQYTDLKWDSQNPNEYTTSYKACSAYSPSSMNSAWNAARAFSMVATSLGTIALLLTCLAFAKPMLWCCVSMMFAVVAVSQGLTFLYFRSNICTGYDQPTMYSDIIGDANNSVSFDGKCHLAVAAKLGIAATVFWALGALTACVGACQGRSYFHHIREMRR